jgi:hypothetical protein
MKAERRHELKQNSLVKKLEDLPRYKQWGTRAMLGVILLAMLIFGWRYRQSAEAARVDSARDSLAAGQEALLRLKDTALQLAEGTDPASVANLRMDSFADGINEVGDAITNAGDNNPMLVASALLCRGDLNFELANIPPLPGAATRPSLQPDQSEPDLLNAAADAYTKVLQDYPDDLPNVTQARFGLAAVAEDRAQSDPMNWDKAKSYFQAILDSAAPELFKDQARTQLALLPNLQKPLALDLFPEIEAPSTMPSTEPTIMGPAAPTTMPTTAPVP